MPGSQRDVTLIFGGSGFVGAHVVRAALEADRDEARRRKRRRGWVVSVSREPQRALDGTEQGLLTAEHDVIADPGVERLFDDLMPTRVIVLTALASIGECDTYPGLAQALNVEFPRRIAVLCERRGVRLVHVSTDLVFGATPPAEGGFREGDPVGPMSAYGRTKAEGEVAVLQACARALVVRLPLCWDESGRGCGAGAPLLESVRKGERPLLFTDEWRTPLHVEEAARGVVAAARGGEVGWLHVAGAERITRYDLGLSLLIASGLEPARARGMIRGGTRKEVGVERVRPGDVCLDAGKARASGIEMRGVSWSLAELARKRAE